MNSRSKLKIVLYGASGHAKVILDILRLSKFNQTDIALYDDNLKEDSFCGYPLIKNKPTNPQWIIAVGNNSTRKEIADHNKFRYYNALHPNAVIADGVTILPGTTVMAGSVINAGASIGSHVIINTASSVDHDCILENFVHISPNATLCGNVFVGEGTHIGAGATLIPGVKIGKWCTIGAGTVIIRDVPDYSTIVGNPGKIIKGKSVDGPE
jgi:sugar O-acyltransferase (sialic acid O-acetyltransferase NeuD family)